MPTVDVQAALHNYKEVAEFLLSNGVDKEVKDMMGLSALDIANKMNLKEIIEILKPKN